MLKALVVSVAVIGKCPRFTFLIKKVNLMETLSELIDFSEIYV